ncbi:MAG: DUF805 domain-containing protein [Anaerolineales bacterium]|jgi:uncharacterized membrane protein YhaH (DUF805 family)
MSEDRREQLYRTFKQKDTDELIEIWRANNRYEWADLTFEVIGELLQERLGELPPQDEPVLEADKSELKAAHTQTSMSLGEVYFSFNGRIGRETYWVKGVLPILVLSFFVGIMDAALFSYSRSEGLIRLIWNLLILWPALALSVKRWHDRDKSGFWVLIGLIPIVGQVWIFIEAGLLPGTDGPNQYGLQSF